MKYVSKMANNGHQQAQLVHRIMIVIGTHKAFLISSDGIRQVNDDKIEHIVSV